MSSTLLGPLLWSFLPSKLTQIALPYLSAILPAVFPLSPKGSPRYAKNYKLAYTLIVLVYLVWSFLGSGSIKPESNWYDLLQVPVDADDGALKRSYRALSRTYHPDRAGEQYEGIFILIRQAYETLTDPVKRYAYDRFGPDIVNWKSCKTVKDYLHAGLIRSAGFYVVTGGFMVVLNFTGRAQQASFWRNTLFAILLVYELRWIFQPSSFSSPKYTMMGIGNQPQFIRIEFAHRLWTSFSVALSQLAGVWFPQVPSDTVAWKHLAALVTGLDEEVASSFKQQTGSLLVESGDPGRVSRLLQAETEQRLVDRTLSSHPLVRPHWQNAQASTNPVAPTSISVQRYPLPPVSVLNRDLEVARRIPLPPSPPPSP